MRNMRLSGRGFDKPDEVVAWHVALQAQDYVPAKWSIAQRSQDGSERSIEDAVSDGSLVRTHVLRTTWHLVARDDIRWLLALTGPRIQQQTAGRYRELGLDARTLARCERVIAAVLTERPHLTREHLAEALHNDGIEVTGQRLPHVLMHCELASLICSGGYIGKKHGYALLDDRAPARSGFDRDTATVELVRRYLRSHGPASLKDLSWWSSLTVADLKEGVAHLGDEVTAEQVEGVELLSMASDSRSVRQPRGARLLQAYDELVVGYTVSRFLGDPAATRLRDAWRHRRLPNGIVLIDGSLTGVWRRALSGRTIGVDVLSLKRLSTDEKDAIEKEAHRLGRFLERSVALGFGTI